MLVMAVLMIAGAVQAVEITKGMSADIHGTLLKPFDVDTGTGTSNDIDYLNIESKHGTWLMDVEGGVRYMNTRAFLGYETTTRSDRKEIAGTATIHEAYTVRAWACQDTVRRGRSIL